MRINVQYIGPKQKVHERGAMTLLMAVTLLIAIFFWALAWNLKYTQVRAQELQAVADAAALRWAFSALSHPVDSQNFLDIPAPSLSAMGGDGAVFNIAAPSVTAQLSAEPGGGGIDAARVELLVQMDDLNTAGLNTSGGLGLFGGASNSRYSVRSVASIQQSSIGSGDIDTLSPTLMFLLDYSFSMEKPVGSLANGAGLTCMLTTDPAVDVIRNLLMGDGLGRICGGAMATIPSLSGSGVKVGLARFGGLGYGVPVVTPRLPESGTGAFQTSLNASTDTASGCLGKTTHALGLGTINELIGNGTLSLDEGDLKVVLLSDGRPEAGATSCNGFVNAVAEAQTQATALKNQGVQIHSLFIPRELSTPADFGFLQSLASVDAECSASGTPVSCAWNGGDDAQRQSFLQRFVGVDYDVLCDVSLSASRFPNFQQKVLQWNEPVYGFVEDAVSAEEVRMVQVTDPGCLYEDDVPDPNTGIIPSCPARQSEHHAFYIDTANNEIRFSSASCQEISSGGEVHLRYGEPRLSL